MSEEPQLHVVRSASLLFDVAFDHAPVAFFADGRDIVAICPEFAAPQLFLEVGMVFFKEVACGDAFVEAYQLSWCVFGVCGTEQMYVISVSSELFDVDGIAFADLVGNVLE